MKKYYLFLNDAAEGPFDAEEIQVKLRQGEIQRGTLVGEDGGTDWTPAGDVFPDIISAVPPPLVAAAPPPRVMPPALPAATNPYSPPRQGYEAAPPSRGGDLNFALNLDGAPIPGTEGLTAGQVVEMVQRGGRFVVWRYNFSIVVLSFRRSSGIRFIRPGESGFLGCFGYSSLSAMVGWWGFPWGVIWTPMSLFRNMAGGQDLTEPVLASVVGPGVADRIIKSRPTTFHWHTLLAGGLPLLFPVLFFMSLVLAVPASSARRSSSRSAPSPSHRSARDASTSDSRDGLPAGRERGN